MHRWIAVSDVCWMVGRQGKTIGDLSFARAVTITAGIGSWALLSRSGKGYKDTCWELPKTWFTVGKWNLFICMKGTHFQPSLSTGFQRLGRAQDTWYTDFLQGHGGFFCLEEELHMEGIMFRLQF